jgi:hypothetical protein
MKTNWDGSELHGGGDGFGGLSWAAAKGDAAKIMNVTSNIVAVMRAVIIIF